MKHRRASRVEVRPAPSGAGRSATVAALFVVSIALLVAFVHRRVIGTFFALDDLVLFQQVHGIIAWPASPWRWLSGVAWFRLVTPIWGEQPVPYHVASLELHALNAVLLGLLARRWGASGPAAWLAGGAFALSPLHFTALMAASSVGELLALSFTLLALLAAGSGRVARLAFLPFALALLAKESVLLVPLAALAVPVADEAARARLRRLAPLAISGIAAGGALLAWGVLSRRLAGGAYAVGFGANVTQNVARLASWSLWPAEAIPDLHAGIVGAGAWAWPLAAVSLMVLAVAATRRPLVRAGVAWWWLAVLPVLPLQGRTYLHYLYTPLAGLALVVAGVFDAALAPARGLANRPGPLRHAPVLVAFALTACGAAFADHQLAARMDAKMPVVDWPLDPVLRKSELARRSISGVREALGGRPAKIVILLPASVAEGVDLGTGRSLGAGVRGRYEVEAVLDEGRSLRAFVPEVERVEFAHDYVPGHEDWMFLVPLSDGNVFGVGTPPRAHAYVISTLLRNDHAPAAVAYANAALADKPREPLYLYMAAFAHQRTGDRAKGLELMRELVRIAPSDSLAPAARRVLAEAGAGR